MLFREEWEWLRTLDTNQAGDIKPTPLQLAFQWSLVSAARILLEDLDVDPDHVPSHRLYRLQVVQVHSDVSFILVVPKVEDVCSAPTQSHTISATEEKRGCLSLSVPVFEMGTRFTSIILTHLYYLHILFQRIYAPINPTLSAFTAACRRSSTISH